MMQSSIYDARNNLSSLIKVAESGTVVEMTRHEKPVAILIGYNEYKSLCEDNDFFSSIKILKNKYQDVLNELSDDDLCFPRNREIPKNKRIEQLFNLEEK